LGDRYEIGDLIGRGGMADVYRAHDTVLDRSVAVKVLRAVTATDARRFADEARLLATLDDPCIVALLDAGVTDERPWLALELVEGSSLRDLMAAGPLDPATAQRIGRDIAAALAHAHGHGIVHRDVKPSNVVMTTDGVAKLTDFGIARLDGATDGITLTGHTIGTAAYLSPEQVRADEVTGAADVYALGLVLLEALTSVRAYPGPATESALARLHHAPLIPTSLPPGWPGLLAAMTAASAQERPSAAEVVGRLGAARFPADVDLVPPTVLVPQRPVLRRRTRLVGIAATVALAGSLTLAQTLGGPSSAVAEEDAAATGPAARSLDGPVLFSGAGTGTAHTTLPTSTTTETSGGVSTPTRRTARPTRSAGARPDRTGDPGPVRSAPAADQSRGEAKPGKSGASKKSRTSTTAAKKDRAKAGKPKKAGRPGKAGKPGKAKAGKPKKAGPKHGPRR